MSNIINNLPLPKLVNYITNFPDSLPSLQQKLSVQTYIPPDSESYKLHDYNKCYASNGLNTTLNMKPVDNNLHTVDDGVKIAAAKQMAFNAEFSSEFSAQTSGLQYFIYEGFSKNEPNFYNKAKLIYSGITSNLSNIEEATGNNNFVKTVSNAISGSNVSQTPLSVEWQGYFIPDTTGLCTFVMSCNANAYMWVGDVAISNYNTSNTIVNTQNGPLTYTGQFTAGNPYMVRIQYGANMINPSFSFNITNANNQISQGEKHLVTSLNNKNIAYFALVENTPQDTQNGLFKCYVTDTTKPNINDQLALPNNGFNLTTIWQLFDTNGPQSLANGTPIFSEGNYLYNDGNSLAVYGQTGTLLRTLGMINPGDIVTFGGAYGDIFIGSINVTNNSRNITAISNPLFVQTYNNFLQGNNINLSVINSGDKILCLPEYFIVEMLTYSNINQYVRISADGCFILFFTLGNLMISTNNSPCINSTETTNYGDIKYTLSTSNSFYPYSVDLQNSSTSANVSYLVFEDNKTKTPITEAVLNSNITTTSKYSTYDDYVPPSGSNSVQLNPSEGSCSSLCDNNPMCNYYYSYQTNNSVNYCSYDNNYSTPTYTQKQSNLNIKSSTLNVKHVGISFDKITDPMEKSFIQNIPQKIITDSSILDNYTMDPTMTFHGVYKQLTSDYYEAIDLVNIMNKGASTMDLEQMNRRLLTLLGRINTSTETFTTIKEGYTDKTYTNTNNYVTGDLTNTASPTPGFTKGVPKEYSEVTSDGLINEIVNAKLNPLEKTASNYTNLLNKINKNYNTITTDVKNINTIRNYLTDNPQYDFSGNMLMGDYYDDNGNLIKFNKYNPSIEDAVVDDTSTMMYRENTLYILGSITAATLLIAAISIAR